MTKKLEISSFTLHLLAMAFMLCDHLWATVVPGNQWLTDLGRLAFPIFAFMLAEGFFRTRNRKKYALRLLIFALLSEVPFDFMYGGTAFYPFHQNVLWTFLLAFGCMSLIQWVWTKSRQWKSTLLALAVPAITAAGVCFAGWLLGSLLMVDYYGAGVLTVLVFYFFHGRRWYDLAGQLVCLTAIHGVLLAGMVYPISLFGLSFDFPQQALALLALVPIWLYRGKQGPHSRPIQLLYYGFYPVHMAILSLLFALR